MKLPIIIWMSTEFFGDRKANVQGAFAWSQKEQVCSKYVHADRDQYVLPRPRKHGEMNI